VSIVEDIIKESDSQPSEISENATVSGNLPAEVPAYHISDAGTSDSDKLPVSRDSPKVSGSDAELPFPQ
jgi:hypothetical protein